MGYRPWTVLSAWRGSSRVRHATLNSQPGERRAVNGYRSWHWVVKVRADRMVAGLTAPFLLAGRESGRVRG